MERYGIRAIIKKRENKPANTTKTNFQSNGNIKHTKKFQNWWLQLHSEQYYIKGVDRVGAYGINQFTESGKIKNQKKKNKKRAEPTKITRAVFQKQYDNLRQW
jgi:hypothetical protein